jgi:hypothetical protein
MTSTAAIGLTKAVMAHISTTAKIDNPMAPVHWFIPQYDSNTWWGFGVGMIGQLLVTLLGVYWALQKEKKRETESERDAKRARAIEFLEGLQTPIASIAKNLGAYYRGHGQSVQIGFQYANFFDNEVFKAIADVKYQVLSGPICAKIDLLNDKLKQANYWLEIVFENNYSTPPSVSKGATQSVVSMDRFRPLADEITDLVDELVLLMYEEYKRYGVNYKKPKRILIIKRIFFACKLRQTSKIAAQVHWDSA